MSIKINIGGKIFETTESTLSKINYFKYMLQDTNINLKTTIIFVDRSPHIFKHVLAFAIDDNYKYPLKYRHELDFYDMPYDETQLYDKTKKIKKYIDEINQKLNEIGKPKCMRYDCFNFVYENNVCKDHAKTCNYNYGNEYCDIIACYLCNNHYRCHLHKDYKN